MNVLGYVRSGLTGGTAGGRLALAALVTAAGAVLGWAAGPGRVMDLVSGAPYFYAVTVLLAIGLYSSTHGIDLRHLRTDLRTVLLAVTVGVLVKAALITAVMLLLFPGPEALVLGVAVAQIDPLSVAALRHSSRMSERGRALLLAWASFDDPVTTLLTIYAATLSVSLNDLDPAAGSAVFAAGGAGAVATGLAADLGLATACTALWLLTRRALSRRGPAGRVDVGFDVGFVVGCGLLLVAGAVAVSRFWMLGVALVGLFVRPALRGAPEVFGRVLDRLTQAAFLLAVLGVGFVLSAGAEPVAGLVLGVAAFAAQAVVSGFLTRAQEPGDRVPLAIAQQNGITAVILALLLQPVFPEVVAIVAPAILVVNVLHLVANRLHERYGGAAPELVAAPLDEPAVTVAAAHRGTPAAAGGPGPLRSRLRLRR